MKETLNQLKDGILTRNPTLVLLLGMCPTLAVSTTLKNGLGMGLTATAVLILSNSAVSLIRKLIPTQIRIAAFIVVISGFVTAADLLLRAYAPGLSSSLGIFIPLIVVNCIILARAEAFASKNGVFRSAVDGLSMGLGFTLALCAVSAVRELLGGGAVWGIDVTLGVYSPALLFAAPCGGFLVLGFVIAAVRYATDASGKRKEAAK